MKLKKLFAAILTATSLLAVAGTADAAVNREVFNQEEYDKVLKELKTVIVTGKYNEYLERTKGEYDVGVRYAMRAGCGEKYLDKIGYVQMDINGDDIPELIIGSVEDPSRVYQLLTYFDGTARQMFKSDYSCQFDYLGGNRFLKYGENTSYGARAFGVARFTGYAMEWDKFYYNAHGEMYTNRSGRVVIPAYDYSDLVPGIDYDDLPKMFEKEYKNVKPLPFTPFRQL
ncbi:hypothetical protein [Phascolarctobacterium sp.]|uniref:hypothetical protein n=1 Tax=Phascolarctobacterium sp. TaxID=2049039 RepID=UPI0038639BBD